jgi:hypothetical protein
MAETQDRALQIALAYFEAWACHDFEKAMTFISPEIICLAPAGEIRGSDTFREFMGPFVEGVLEARLVGAFGQEETAMVMYDAETRLVARAPGAEHVTVDNGQIIRMQIIFDRLPFEEARRSLAESATKE